MGLVIFGAIALMVVLSKVLPARITSSPLALPVAVGIVSGILVAPIIATVAISAEWVPEGSFSVVCAAAYVAVVLLGAAFGALRSVLRRAPN